MSFLFCLLTFLPAAQPNIVVIVADDYDQETTAETPTLDRLAAQSVVLTRALVPMSLCRPSLAALISGQYPWQTGVLSNDGCGPLTTENALPALLRDAGYAVRYEGKFWEPSPTSPDPAAYGVTSVGDCARQSQFMLAGGQRATREWIYQQSTVGTPWALFACPYLPHQSYPTASPPQRYLDMYPVGSGRTAEQQDDLARVTWLDDQIGDLLGVVSLAGQWENTIVVWFSDNGWSGDGAPSKGTWTDRGLATPVYFRIPAVPPRVVGGQFSTIDLYPTILDLADITIPPTASGQSRLQSIILGDEGTDTLYGLCSSAVSPQPVAYWMRTPDGRMFAKTLAPSSSSHLWRYSPTFATGDEFTEGTDAELLRDPAAAWYAGLGLSQATIADDAGPDFSTSGTWSLFASGYSGTCRYAASGTGSAIAQWSFIVAPGSYRVSATWAPHTNRATNAPFSIADQTILVNQELAPDDRSDAGASWEDLGVFPVTGTALIVRLSNNANEYVIADAVRVEKL